MSRPVTITDSVTLHPSGYDSSTLQSYSTSNLGNAYAGSSNTSYAQINLTRNANAVTNIDYTFSLPSGTIPSGSTINSVTCTAKCSINNTQSSRITTRTIQLYSGSTAKGSAYTVANSTTAFSITAGSWTLSELQTSIKIKLYAVRGTSSTTSSYYFRFYGCDFTINYSLSGTEYEITASTSANTITLEPTDEYVLSGNNYQLQIVSSNTSPIVVQDNNVDVSSQIVEQSSTSSSVVIDGYTGSSGFTLNNIDNANSGSDSSNYASLETNGGTTGTIYFTFADPLLPSSASIQSVACTATFEYNRNSSSSGYSASCQLYANTTAKGSSTTITTTGGSSMSKTTFNLTPGSWTISDLANARLYVTVTNSASSTHRFLYVYGATLTITYSFSGKIYTYTLTNVTADHTIVVAVGATDALYVKQSGSWVQVAKAYKKVNGSWVEQSDITTVFQNGVHYVKGSV